MLLTVEKLAQLLITPYEELRINEGKSCAFHKEYAANDYRQMSVDGSLDEDLIPFIDAEITKIDCYYSGDHMVLELEVNHS